MRRVRIIPVLLRQRRGLVKTRQFTDPSYLGDPINIVRIFNEKEVDELVLLDIDATPEGRGPDLSFVEEVVSECFMPVCYGGGLRDLDQVKRVFDAGVEKISVNSRAAEDPGLVSEVAATYGNQSVVASIDVKKGLLSGYEVRTCGGRTRTGLDPATYARDLETAGAGEILLNSIDRDGTMNGYDLKLVQQVSSAVSVPVIACGGAATVQDLLVVVKEGGASAAGAGSLFVYQGRHRAVLITYPQFDDLEELFAEI